MELRRDNESIQQWWERVAWPHQIEWFNARHDKERFYIADRQMGASIAFAVESVVVQAEEERKQIFVSPTEAQAQITRTYINSLGVDTRNDYRFCSYKQFVARPPCGGFDLYIMDYFWFTDEGLENMRDVIRQTPVKRTTWITAVPDDYRYGLMLRSQRFTNE